MRRKMKGRRALHFQECVMTFLQTGSSVPSKQFAAMAAGVLMMPSLSHSFACNSAAHVIQCIYFDSKR